MKKILLIFGILFSLKVQASHISGGDLTYTWVGPSANTYLVTLNLYRDCSGIAMTTSESVNATSTCGGSQNFNLPLINQGVEISQLCNNLMSTCNGGVFPGMQHYIYQDTVTLSPACNTWTLSWSTCCRNNSVNVPSSPTDDIYISATMNSITAPQNNAPSFTSQPIPYVCVNQPVNYSYGVYDPDGDSLAFSLISGFNIGGSSLAYAVGYSGSVPIADITINPINGNIIFTPTILGNFIVVMQVKEYSSTGQLKSTVMRDMQFVVLNCGNNLPDINSGTITNVVGNATQTGPMELKVCEGEAFTFTAVYTDLDMGDTLSISTNLGTIIPNSTYTISGSNPLTVVYSLIAPAGTNTTFISNISDSNCPLIGLQTFVYSITLLDRTFVGPDLTICGAQTAQINASGGNVFTWYDMSGNLVPITPQFSCNPCANPIAQPTTTTSYVVVSDLVGSCINSDTITVNIASNFTFALSQSTNSACLLQPIQLNCAPSPGGSYAYNWTPASYMSDPSIANPIMNPTTSGTYWVHNTVISAAGCMQQDSLQVTISPNAAPVITAVSDTVCLGSAHQLNVTFGSNIPTVCGTTANPCLGPSYTGMVGTGNATNSTSGYPAIFGNWFWGARHQILYTAVELNAMGFNGGKISSIAFNILNINSSTSQYNNFEIKMKCTNASSLSNWESGLSVVYPAQNYTVSLGWNSFQLDSIYEWDGVSNLVIETCFNNGIYSQNCSNSYTTTAFNSVLYYRADMSNVCNSGSPTTSNQRPNLQIGYCAGTANPANYTYAWIPASQVINDTIQNPFSTVPAASTYTVIVTDIIGGCSDTAVVVTQNNSATAPLSPVISINNGILYTNTGFSYQWFLNGAAIAGADSSSIFPAVNGDYMVQIFDTIGCSSLSAIFNYTFTETNSRTINTYKIFPIPTSNQLNIHFTDINESRFIQLFATTGELVLSKKLTLKENSINTGKLAVGMYFYMIYTENSRYDSGKVFIVDNY